MGSRHKQCKSSQNDEKEYDLLILKQVKLELLQAGLWLKILKKPQACKDHLGGFML